MSIKNAIKQGLTETKHSTAMVSGCKLVKRLVLKQFLCIIDFLMHIAGLTKVPVLSLQISPGNQASVYYYKDDVLKHRDELL